MKKTFYFLLLFVLGLSACKKEEKEVSPPVPSNELLTTARLTLISADHQDTVVAIWRDVTPEDATSPDTSLALLNLKIHTHYSASLELLDETKSPVEEITSEIQERGNYHRIFYFPSAGLSPELAWNVNDLDTNNPPLAIGLTADVSCDSVSSGYLNVILKHQPNVKDGTFAPGSTDMDVNFRVLIQP